MLAVRFEKSVACRDPSKRQLEASYKRPETLLVAAAERLLPSAAHIHALSLRSVSPTDP